MQFRQGNREMDVQVNQKELSVDQKLAETEKMFSTSKLDQIKAEKEEIMRQLSGSQLTVKVSYLFKIYHFFFAFYLNSIKKRDKLKNV